MPVWYGFAMVFTEGGFCFTVGLHAVGCFAVVECFFMKYASAKFNSSTLSSRLDGRQGVGNFSFSFHVKIIDS